MGPRFDGDCFVDDIAFNPGAGRKPHFEPADAAHDTAIDNNIIGNHFAADGGTFANGQKMRADVALNRAFNLNVAGRFHVAGDR